MEDPGQNISLLNQYDYDDDASLSDGGGVAMAETAFDSPAETAPDYRLEQAPTAGSSLSGQSSTTGVKEPPQTAMKLPLDQTDYLQPQSSLPATYLDLVATPGNSIKLLTIASIGVAS